MFDRVVVISLTTERWGRFQSRLPPDWPFAEPVCFKAINGLSVPMRRNWRKPAKDWGCLLSHLAIMDAAIAGGIGSVLILEDDAVFCDGFAAKAAAFMAAVPDDWEQVYLGGQHLQTTRHRLLVVNDQVITCGNVNRTHAHAMRLEYVKTARDFIAGHDYNLEIDYQFGKLHPGHRVYAPWQWLVGQGDGDEVQWWNVPLRVYREGEKRPLILNIGRSYERSTGRTARSKFAATDSGKRRSQAGSRSHAGVAKSKRQAVRSDDERE